MKLKRFLLRYYPPGIILEYESGGVDFTKPIDLLGLTPDVDIDVLLNQIVRGEPLLSEKRKPQLAKLVNKLIDKLEENADHADGASAKQAEEEPEPEANPKAPLTRFKKTKEEIYAALSQEDKAKADEARDRWRHGVPKHWGEKNRWRHGVPKPLQQRTDSARRT